jgi:hypothetical protein
MTPGSFPFPVHVDPRRVENKTDIVIMGHNTWTMKTDLFSGPP